MGRTATCNTNPTGGGGGHLLSVLLGPVGHARLQAVQLGQDEACVSPQGVGALVQLHLLPAPRVLLPAATQTHS